MIDRTEPLPDSPFADVVLGAPIGRYDEPIIRVHHGTAETPYPSWCDPRANDATWAQYKGDFVVFIMVERDDTRRDAEHPFASDIEANAVHVDQLGFF